MGGQGWVEKPGGDGGAGMEDARELESGGRQGAGRVTRAGVGTRGWGWRGGDTGGFCLREQG